MISTLNRLVEYVEDHLTEDIDIAALSASFGTTEYHLRRMFSSLAGMPLSEYIRRRRMTVAAADVLGDREPAGTAVIPRRVQRARRNMRPNSSDVFDFDTAVPPRIGILSGELNRGVQDPVDSVHNSANLSTLCG